MIVRHFLGVINHCRLPLTCFAAMMYLSVPVLNGKVLNEKGKDDNKEAIAKLTKDFKSSEPIGKLVVIEKLAKLGVGAAGPLCDAMLDNNDQVSTAALVALENAHPKLYKEVAKLVLDTDLKNQAKALEEISAMGADALPTLSLLVARCRSSLSAAEKDRQYLVVVKAYSKAISAIGAEERETIDLFKHAAKSTLAPARDEAFGWLVRWAGDKEDRRKEVLPSLKSGIAIPGSEAIPFIKVAGQYKELSKAMLPQLKKLKLSGVAAVREAATEAVQAIEN